MITIYNYTSPKKRKYFVLKRKRNYFKTLRHRRRSLSFPTTRRGYLGSIRLFLVFLFPIVLLSGIWLYLFANNLSLDYQINDLRQKISKLEEETLDLQEQLSRSTSLEQIEEWAQKNGFVEVNKIGYLDLSNSNIAQAPSGF